MRKFQLGETAMASGAAIGKYVALGLLLAVIVGGGYVQGRWTDRWREVPAVKLFADQFKNVPMVIGAWQGEAGEEPTADVLEQAGAAGSLTRIYRGPQGESVHMFIVCGKMRDVLWHTPENCYPANGFEMVGEPELQTIETNGGEAEFYTTAFIKTDPTGSMHQRIYWAWCGSEGWKAPRDARSAFAGDRAMYKLYVVALTDRSDKGGATTKSNAATDFIRVLMPELTRAFEPATSAI